MLISYKKPRGRFFIVGKGGSGPVPPTPTMRHIKVNVSGGNGTMTVDGEQVTLDADNYWEADYQDGTQITLAITTDSGHSMCCWFDRTRQLWADNGYTSYDNPVTITMSGDYTIDTQIDTLLNVTLLGASGQGKVGWSGQTPDYSATKTGMYPGMCEDIYAYPETGYEFVEWQTSDFNLGSPTANPSHVCPNNDGTITAVFQAQVQYYSVSVSAGSNGSVAVNGVQGDYSDSVASGTTLTLAATANNGYQFSQWSDGDNTNPRTITVTGPVTLAAAFQEAAPQQPNDEIWYTTTDSQTVTPYDTSAFAPATITSNAYSDGKGVIKFDQNLTEVGNNAFEDCTRLTSVTIPNSVTSIGESAFGNCSGLTSIVVEEGNTVYDSRNNCNAIVKTSTNTLITGCQNTVIPNSVTSIWQFAFGNCSGLTSIVIPDSVTSIGEGAFQDCKSLVAIESLATTAPTIYSRTFRWVAQNGTLTVPSGADYSAWMQTSQYYLGLYNWTLVQQ